MKNMRNNLLNGKIFVFPACEFRKFDIQFSDGNVIWGDIHKMYEFETNIMGHSKKVLKLYLK